MIAYLIGLLIFFLNVSCAAVSVHLENYGVGVFCGLVAIGVALEITRDRDLL